MHRPLHAFVALTVLAASGCGRALSPGDAPSDAAAPDAVLAPLPTATCDEVRATCTASTLLVVHGHASGLVGLEGARAEFAVQYDGPAHEASIGPPRVAAASAEVRGGAFEACVCMPRDEASRFPAIAAVVFRPGTTGETRAEVARAMFSQRYIALGEEDVSDRLMDAPSPVEAEVALAAMVVREALMSVHDLDPAFAGRQVRAGSVADERSIAASVAMPNVSGGAVQFDWTTPGLPWPSERVALYVGVDGDRRCTAADRGGVLPFVAGRAVAADAIAWVEGAALVDLCRAAALDADRLW